MEKSTRGAVTLESGTKLKPMHCADPAHTVQQSSTDTPFSLLKSPPCKSVSFAKAKPPQRVSAISLEELAADNDICPGSLSLLLRATG